MERDILVRPTKMTRPVKVDHLQSWSRIFRSDQTEIDHSIWSTNRNFWNFGLNENKEPLDSSLWRILRFTLRLHTAYLPNYFQLFLLKFCHTLLTNLCFVGSLLCSNSRLSLIRGVGRGFVLLCGNSGGVGSQFLINMENPGRWGVPHHRGNFT